jgi:hypothetical protein
MRRLACETNIRQMHSWYCGKVPPVEPLKGNHAVGGTLSRLGLSNMQ